MTTIEIAVLQYKVLPTPTETERWLVTQLNELGEKGTQIACLPEMHRMKYFPRQRQDDTDATSGPNANDAFSWQSDYGKQLRQIAAKFKMVIVMGVVQYDLTQHKPWQNLAYVIREDGKVLGPYAKTHIPQDPGFWEQDYFAPAQENYLIAKTAYGNIAPLICFDQWFPEAARVCALRGADILVYPTAIGIPDDYEFADENWIDAWQTVQRAHAITNGVHVIATNRIGREGNITFFGRSFVSDAFGNVIMDCQNDEFAGRCKINRGMNARIKSGWGVISHRRPDTYQDLITK